MQLGVWPFQASDLKGLSNATSGLTLRDIWTKLFCVFVFILLAHASPCLFKGMRNHQSDQLFFVSNNASGLQTYKSSGSVFHIEELVTLKCLHSAVSGYYGSDLDRDL